MHIEIIKYSIATYLDGIGFDEKIPSITDLNQVFTHAGEGDNDVILQKTSDGDIPIYRWCEELSKWTLIQ